MTITKFFFATISTTFFFLSTPLSATQSINKVKDLKIGNGHVCVLFVEGSVKCWGENYYGHLGLGDTMSRGNASTHMGSQLPFVKMPSGTRVTKVATGAQHTCALLDNGKIKCWGSNQAGNLGLGSVIATGGTPDLTPDKTPYASLGTDLIAKDIAAGHLFSCALFTNGRVKCWGSNQNGQLANGDKKIIGDRPETLGDNMPFAKLGAKPVARIFAQYATACALFEDGALKCWGQNSIGKLGIGSAVDYIGADERELGENLKAVDLGDNGSNVYIKDVALSDYTACALLSNGNAKCWGYNIYGELGQGDTETRGRSPETMGNNLPPIAVSGSGLSIQSIGIGGATTCASLNNHGVKCWGSQKYGSLGSENSMNLGSLQEHMGENLPFVDLGWLNSVKKVEVGRAISCALFTNGRVKCWGLNDGAFAGYLGIGSLRQHIGDLPGDMGDNLPFVDL